MNLFTRLKSLLPDSPLLIAKVISLTSTGATVQFPDGSLAIVRGSASIDQTVFVKDGTIEGPAPELPIVVIEI